MNKLFYQFLRINSLIIKYVLFFVVIFVPVNANSISDKTLNSAAEPNGAWTTFNMADDYKTAWRGEFNKYERTNDGTIYLPIYSVDFNSGKQKTSIEWMRINCNEDFVTNLGSYKDGKFSYENNPLTRTNDPNMNYYTARLFVCPTDADNGKKALMFALYANPINKTGNLITWIPEEIEIDNTNKNIISFNAYTSGFNKGKIILGFKSKFILNCSSEKLDSPEENIFRDLKEEKSKHLRFLYNTACGKNDILDFLKSEKKDLNEQQLEKVKIKCRNLGFVEKTEKFGACVLEFLK